MDSMQIDLPGLPLGQDFKSVLEAAKKHLQIQKGFNLDLTLQQWEKGYVEAALLITQGNLSQAAKLLGNSIAPRSTAACRITAHPAKRRIRRSKNRARHRHYENTNQPRLCTESNGQSWMHDSRCTTAISGLRSAACFRITPNTEFFYSGGNRGPILEALIYRDAAGRP